MIRKDVPKKKTFWEKIKEENEKEKERISKIKKGFVWYGLRTLLWTIIAIWWYDILFLNNEAISNFLIWFYLVLSPPLFILAIIHLNIYKKESLLEPILSIIISVSYLFFFLMALASV